MKREYRNAIKALELVGQARRTFDAPEYGPLVTSLEKSRDEMADIIRTADETRYGIGLLRPDFYFGMNTTRISVHRPNERDDLPWIDPEMYKCLQLVLCGKDVRVDAPYDVEVKANGIRYCIIKGTKQ